MLGTVSGQAVVASFVGVVADAGQRGTVAVNLPSAFKNISVPGLVP